MRRRFTTAFAVLAAVVPARAFSLAVSFAFNLAIPFSLLAGQVETNVAREVFGYFKELYGIVSRLTAQEVQQKREARLSFDACPSLPGRRSTSGPYVVVDRRSLSSVVLRDLSS